MQPARLCFRRAGRPSRCSPRPSARPRRLRRADATRSPARCGPGAGGRRRCELRRRAPGSLFPPGGAEINFCAAGDMSKKKGLSFEEKRVRMMEIFFETKDVFQLKDIEKIAPKEKGITSVSVKEILQSLVDDGMVDTDRIGTSNYFWAFPSKALHARKRKLEDLESQTKDMNVKDILPAEEEKALGLTRGSQLQLHWAGLVLTLQGFREAEAISVILGDIKVTGIRYDSDMCSNHKAIEASIQQYAKGVEAMPVAHQALGRLVSAAEQVDLLQLLSLLPLNKDCWKRTKGNNLIQSLHVMESFAQRCQIMFAESSQKKETLQKSIEKSKIGRENTAERAALIEELAALRQKKEQLKAEIEKYRECDPDVVEEMRQTNKVAKEAANRWTDNIFSIKSWAKRKFGFEESRIDKSFGIPEDLDYID
ncbi:Mnd1 [Columba guinea]|nr:Mnd1 [Columba guinea]